MGLINFGGSCSGPCETCENNKLKNCMVGHGDDHYMPVRKESNAKDISLGKNHAQSE